MIILGEALDFLCKKIKHHWKGWTAIITCLEMPVTVAVGVSFLSCFLSSFHPLQSQQRWQLAAHLESDLDCHDVWVFVHHFSKYYRHCGNDSRWAGGCWHKKVVQVYLIDIAFCGLNGQRFVAIWPSKFLSVSCEVVLFPHLFTETFMIFYDYWKEMKLLVQGQQWSPPELHLFM